jgi:hypothetical protein
VIDVMREQDLVEPSPPQVYRVNWFHVERPVTGTTFRRQVVPQPRPATATDEVESG